MQLSVIKDQIIKEAARLKKDDTYVSEITLDSEMNEYRNIFESLHPSKYKTHPKGSVMLFAILW
jgi:hypothetical protein